MVLILSSCKKEAEFNAYNVGLTILPSVDISLENVVGATVKLNNLEKKYAIESIVNSEGKISFSGVEPGFYSATMSHSYGDGLIEYNLNSLLELNVFGSVSETLPVILSTSNPLIIKEFYFNGSRTPAGKSYYSDQYIEIYNNTAVVQYADGLSIIEHESTGTKTNYWIDMLGVIVVKMIWTIPGAGNDYPVQPGESIVMARNAFDHQSDEFGNPNSPVNMGNADFEFWVDHATGRDIDNHSVTNMIEELFTYRGYDVAFGVSGTSAIGLAKISPDATERTTYINNNLIAKEGSSRYFCILPIEMVGDAVEVVRDEARSQYKRFPSELDAGYIYNTAGSKSGKCIRRKVKEIIDGRTVYQDTNNSTEDFLSDVDPKPWIYE